MYSPRISTPIPPPSRPDLQASNSAEPTQTSKGAFLQRKKIVPLSNQSLPGSSPITGYSIPVSPLIPSCYSAFSELPPCASLAEMSASIPLIGSEIENEAEAALAQINAKKAVFQKADPCFLFKAEALDYCLLRKGLAAVEPQERSEFLKIVGLSCYWWQAQPMHSVVDLLAMMPKGSERDGWILRLFATSMFGENTLPLAREILKFSMISESKNFCTFIYITLGIASNKLLKLDLFDYLLKNKEISLELLTNPDFFKKLIDNPEVFEDILKRHSECKK